MSLLPKALDISFERVLQLLPRNYEALAREHGAFVRARKIKSPRQLLQLVLGYCGLDQSLRECAGQMTLLGARLSDTAVNKRLKGCLTWVEAMLGGLVQADAQRLVVGGLRFVLVDSSTVQGPGARETWYRLHLALDLVRLRFVSATVSDKHASDELSHYGLNEGDVVVADRGFNQVGDWIAHAQQGILLVVRYNAEGAACYDASSAEKLDLEARLSAAGPQQRCWPVQVRARRQRLEGYLHALALPPEQAEQARRRVHQRAKKRGRTPRQRTRLFAGGVLVFTTVPPSVLSSDILGPLYRLRWQVELAIKRLKSVLDLDELRSREGSVLAQVYLHGKLLYAWLVERLLGQRCGPEWNHLAAPRQATPWRIWKTLHRELTTLISGVQNWNLERWPQCLEVMQERPRKRKLQTLPARIIQLITFCQTNGFSNIGGNRA
jgi:hypothetical protein